MRARSWLLGLSALAIAAACGQPAAAAPEGRWYAVQLHAHSRYSDGVHHARDMIRWAREGGLDALALTEHNTDVHLQDAALAAASDVLLIPAYEWTSERRSQSFQGHASLWGLRPGLPILSDHLDHDALVAEAAKQGLTIGVNHPFEPQYPWPGDTYAGVHAMEVWHWQYHMDEAGAALPEDARRPHHDWWGLLHRNARALRAWEDAMRAGRHVTPVAVADFHLGLIQQIERPCTLVWSRERSVEGILEGLRRGHVALVEEPKGPRVELWADADRDGDCEALAGDTVPAGSRLELRVTGGKGLWVTLFDAEGRAWRAQVPTEDWRTERAAEKAGFYWARLDADHFWNPLKGMTGALFVRDNGAHALDHPQLP